MNKHIVGIIPLAGNASRIKNIPKYLLPCKTNYTLLDNTIEIFNKNDINNLYAGVSNNNNFLLQNNNQLNKLVVNTKTMAETVYLLKNHLDNQNDDYNIVLIMPDTYFYVNNEINTMKNYLTTHAIVVMVWKIKDYQIGKVGQCKIENDEVVDVIDKDSTCTYPYFWGVIGWSSSINKYIDPKWETIGELIKKCIELKISVKAVICENYYYDCGTFEEYFKMIKNET